MDFTEKKSLESPQLQANFLSKFFYCWIIPLFKKGAKEDLTLDDLYDRIPEDDAGYWGATMERMWEKETRGAKAKGKKPSFVRTCIRIFGWRFAFLGIFVFFDEMFLRGGVPFVLRQVLYSFSAVDGPKTSFHLNQFLWVCVLILITWAHSVAMHKLIVNIDHLAWKARVATASMIYRKVLKLTKTVQMEEANIGKLINMLSTDCARFEPLGFHFHMLYMAPIQACILFYFLWQELGIACLTGVGIIIGVLIPLQVVVGRLSVKFRTQISKRTDERGRMMSEIIGGIRIIKIYAWEWPFAAVIHELRKREMLTIKKGIYLRCVFQTMMQLSKTTIPYFTFMVYYYLGNELTAEKVYFTIIAYQVVLLGMVQKVPLATAQMGEFLVAIRRIEAFLSLDEVAIGNPRSNQLLKNGTHEVIGDHDLIKSLVTKTDDTARPRILIQNLTAMWTPVKPTLSNISIDVSGNQLVILVGPVGAGKSSILSLLIKELPISSGTLDVSGRISYASQDVWIFSGTIRQNILFGSFLNEKLYSSVINACALNEDFAQMPNGDETVVGERGITLSGGQKARINLARALYRQGDVYLLDDPLSAVDPRVSRHLFEKCMKEHLDGKLRILATHQLQYLPQADHVVVLNKDGEILSQGTYHHLISQGVNFVSILGSGEDNEDSVDNNSTDSETKSISKDKSDTNTIPSLKDKADKSEQMQKGSVSLQTYWEYFKSGNSKLFIGMIVFCFIGTQAALSFMEVWLSKWTNEISRRSLAKDDSLYDAEYTSQTYMLVYSVAVLTIAMIISCRSLTFYHYCMRICVNLHDRMLQGLVRAPVKFYDENSSGRIINRFTKDMNSIDESLPTCSYDFITILLTMTATMIVVSARNYYLCFPALLVFVGMWKLRKFYIKTSRDLKRLESITKSPEFTHLTASVQGLATIRALQAEEKLVDQFDSILDIHTSAFYLSLISQRWFGLCLDVICVSFLACVSFGYLTLGYAETVEIGSVGLAITLTLNLMGICQWGIRQSADTENYMTAVERAFEYCRITPEASLETDEGKKPPKDWPHGGISFQKVYLSYEDSDVLVDLNFEIKPKEKIGVVGRTGAGKSSILVALYRLTECRGDIYIDGVSIKQLGLHDLRKSISIIPQDPVLFSGTMRYNLDPFEEFKDHELWQAISEVNLRDAVTSLDFYVSDGGTNFSVGERQLVCLARAILRKNKIIVMDEATANVDPATDLLIQKAIRERFTDCTIITIAHRLHSVIDNDRILVLDHGQLMEYDTPCNLLDKPQGLFASMVSQAGPSCEAHLRELASANKSFKIQN